jgi:hypothetical protein
MRQMADFAKLPGDAHGFFHGRILTIFFLEASLARGNQAPTPVTGGGFWESDAQGNGRKFS